MNAGVHTRAWSGRVIQSCQNKNPRTRGCEWRHAPEACAEDFGGFEESGIPGSEEEGWLSLARRSQASGLVAGAHVVWDRCKSQHRKIVPLSLCQKPFNSKVIKSFVPELRSRKCFSCFGLVSLFNGISTLFRLFNAKAVLLEEQ